MSTLALRPISAERAPGVLEVREHPEMFDLDAQPVLAQVVDGHAFGDLAIEVSPGRPVCRGSSPLLSVGMPANLRVPM